MWQCESNSELMTKITSYRSSPLFKWILGVCFKNLHTLWQVTDTHRHKIILHDHIKSNLNSSRKREGQKRAFHACLLLVYAAWFLTQIVNYFLIKKEGKYHLVHSQDETPMKQGTQDSCVGSSGSHDDISNATDDDDSLCRSLKTLYVICYQI